MALQNNLSKQLQGNQQLTFSERLKTPQIKGLIVRALDNPKKQERFTTGLISAVGANPALKECDITTVISSALLGEALGLSPSPQLGHYYMVPFKNNKRNKIDAQFQLGYKGYIQLALRSGQYKNIGVTDIRQGELVRYDRLFDDIEVDFIADEDVREQTPVIGYAASFVLTNGMKKVLYWSKSKMEKHALKYSKGYQAKKGYTYWEKDFDGMAYKTMLRQLISKWGIMSIEMQSAYESDMGAIQADNTIDYVDTFAMEEPEMETKEMVEVVQEPVPQVQQETNFAPF